MRPVPRLAASLPRRPPACPELGNLRALLVCLSLVSLARSCDPDNANITHSCKNCVPAGATMFYQTTYYVPDFAPLFVGSTHGWDASDPRYRWNGIPYGNWATPIYTHPVNTSATLFLGSAHILKQDPAYMSCMNIGATLNMAATRWHHMDALPYWTDPSINGGPWRPYPNISVNAQGYPDMRMTETDWVLYWSDIETWLDNHLGNGTSVFLHDNKGCRGAAAVGIYYLMRKQGSQWEAAFNEVLGKRPCISWLTLKEWPNRWQMAQLKAFTPTTP